MCIKFDMFLVKVLIRFLGTVGFLLRKDRRYAVLWECLPSGLRFSVAVAYRKSMLGSVHCEKHVYNRLGFKRRPNIALKRNAFKASSVSGKEAYSRSVKFYFKT
jgi:hypothetical protein